MVGLKKKREHGFIEAATSGGAVYELGVKTSKKDKAIRRIAHPLTEKHWRNTGQSVTKLHRIYRVAEYLYKRQRRYKK